MSWKRTKRVRDAAAPALPSPRKVAAVTPHGADPCGFDLLPDDVIAFILVPRLSFAASVALERCSKRLQRVLGRTKRERCDAWLLRDVLRIKEAKIEEALALLAKAARREDGIEVFHFSSWGYTGEHVAPRASLQDTLLTFIEAELNLETDGDPEHLANTRWKKGYWLAEPTMEAKVEASERTCAFRTTLHYSTLHYAVR